jgi:hypothetical protein
MKSLGFDSCLVYQHDRNVIADGIDALTMNTFEPTPVFFEHYLGLANGTDENFQQLFADCH